MKYFLPVAFFAQLTVGETIGGENLPTVSMLIEMAIVGLEKGEGEREEKPEKRSIRKKERNA